jgi:hypothetical protein
MKKKRGAALLLERRRYRIDPGRPTEGRSAPSACVGRGIARERSSRTELQLPETSGRNVRPPGFRSVGLPARSFIAGKMSAQHARSHTVHELDVITSSRPPDRRSGDDDAPVRDRSSRRLVLWIHLAADHNNRTRAQRRRSTLQSRTTPQALNCHLITFTRASSGDPCLLERDLQHSFEVPRATHRKSAIDPVTYARDHHASTANARVDDPRTPTRRTRTETAQRSSGLGTTRKGRHGLR